MKTYIIYYSCPHCPHKCIDDDKLTFTPNEMLYAETAAEARQYFNNCKPCRWQKITRIVKDAD